MLDTCGKYITKNTATETCIRYLPPQNSVFATQHSATYLFATSAFGICHLRIRCLPPQHSVFATSEFGICHLRIQYLPPQHSVFATSEFGICHLSIRYLPLSIRYLPPQHSVFATSAFGVCHLSSGMLCKVWKFRHRYIQVLTQLWHPSKSHVPGLTEISIVHNQGRHAARSLWNIPLVEMHPSPPTPPFPPPTPFHARTPHTYTVNTLHPTPTHTRTRPHTYTHTRTPTRTPTHVHPHTYTPTYMHTPTHTA